MINHLLQALAEMLPDADISLVAERPWHSLAFAGSQITVMLTLSGDGHVAVGLQFASQLIKQEFDIPDYLVADIAVTDKVADQSRTALTIDALLLDA